MTTKNGIAIEIATATKFDARDIINYLNIVGGESDNLTFGAGNFHISVSQEELYIEKINKENTSRLFVAKIGDEVVSVTSVSGSHKERVLHVVEIGMSVKKAYWGQGIGSLMMEKVIEFVKSLEVVKVIKLETRVDNIPAINLYEKFGFEKGGVVKKGIKIQNEYHDVVIMTLEV